MSTLFNKFLHDYHNAHEWAHQHTAMVIGGIVMVSALLVTQITSFMNGSTHADRTPTWCQDNAGFLQIPEEECDILLDFYLATDGDNWNSNNGWFDDPSTICRGGWYGISGCEWDMNVEKYRLQYLDLQNNNLSGTVPSNFYTLPELESFNLYRNPYLIVDLDELTASPYPANFRTINVHNNRIYGTVNGLINFVNLEYLDIGCYWDAPVGNCTATGDTSFVPSLPNLYGIKLGYNTGIVFNLADLSGRNNIREIFALENYIVGDMNVLAANTGMTFLDLGCWGEYWGGRCNVSGHMNTLSDMMNLQYLSLDGLLTIQGNLDVLYDKIQLSDIDLSHNKLTGTIGTGIGNLINVGNLDLNDNLLEGTLPLEMYNLISVWDLELNENNFVGPLLDFSLLPSLQELNIGQNDFDYSNVWDMVLHSGLIKLEINEAGLDGNLPDIWDQFPLLQRLELRMNDLSGPLPPSLASLTQLSELTLHFNNFDGPIPAYLMNLNLEGGEVSLEFNCFDTNNMDTDLVNFLQANAQGWSSQTNCIANLDIDASLEDDLVAGSCATYTISYENLGPQKAMNVNLGQVFDEQLIVSGSNPLYTTGLVGRLYGTGGDICYEDAMTQASGPYIDWFDNLIQTQYGFPPLYGFATGYAGFTGEQGTTEFAAVIDLLCPFIFQTSDFYLCMYLFGQDLAALDPLTCGVGGEEGYLWNLGTVPNGGSGTIQIELCVPANASGSVSIDSQLKMISDNENDDGNDEDFEFTIVGPGDPNPEIDVCSNIPGTQTSTPDGMTNTGGICTSTNSNNDDDDDTPSGGDSDSPRSKNTTPTAQQDDCLPNPPGDLSPSYYDGKCDTEHKSAEEETIVDYRADPSIVEKMVRDYGNQYSKELIEAYLWARNVGMTSVNYIDQALLYGSMTREQLAKIASQYAIKLLGKKPDTSKTTACSSYNDIAGRNDLTQWMQIACTLSIMGYKSDGQTIDSSFRPDEIVTRAQFLTTLSRMLFGGTYNSKVIDDEYWYLGHMQAMKTKGYVTDISQPFVEEMRGYALLMLYRTIPSLQNILQK